MSDTRREIAERHLKQWLNRDDQRVGDATMAAMSEYAAAVLEDVAQNLWRNGADEPPPPKREGKQMEDRVHALRRLRARASQERER